MRFLRVTVAGVFGKDNITKLDLTNVKDGSIDYLLDLDTQKYFDAEKNEWIEFVNVEDKGTLEDLK